MSRGGKLGAMIPPNPQAGGQAGGQSPPASAPGGGAGMADAPGGSGGAEAGQTIGPAPGFGGQRGGQGGGAEAGQSIGPAPGFGQGGRQGGVAGKPNDGDGAGMAGAAMIPGGGGPEMGGAPGGGGPDANAAPDFTNPVKGVNSFLSAIKSRDAERISNAVALRSRTEAKDVNKPIFGAMLDKSLTEDAISDLARNYEGMSVINYTPLTETGKASVRVGKQNGREIVERSLIVRKEKAGWKVLDFDKFREYTPMGASPGRGNTRPSGKRR